MGMKNETTMTLYSEMPTLPLCEQFARQRGIPSEKSACLELICHINATGWGHIPVWEYPCFDATIELFETDEFTYEEFLEDIVSTCRDIYNDPDYEGDEGFHLLLTTLDKVAPGRFVA